MQNDKTAEALDGTIYTENILELNCCIWPWDLCMSQMSREQMPPHLDFSQVNRILLSHER